MKKIRIIALLLAALTLIATFTGCGKTAAPETTSGVNQSTPADDTQASALETTTEKSAFPLAGTWKEIQRTEEEVSNYITIDEDGNATTSTGDELRFTTEPGESEWDEDLVIGRCEGKPVKFIRYGDSYIISVGNVGYGARYYYREDEYADYDVVELTAENMTDYIECYDYYDTHEDDDGVTWVSHRENARFKAGLGPHSFVFGELTHTVYYKDVTVDPATGEVTVDETSKRYGDPDAPWATYSVNFCGAGDYSSIFGSGKSIRLEGTDPIEEIFSYTELTGAKEIVGKVYVPKGWTL